MIAIDLTEDLKKNFQKMASDFRKLFRDRIYSKFE